MTMVMMGVMMTMRLVVVWLYEDEEEKDGGEKVV